MLLQFFLFAYVRGQDWDYRDYYDMFGDYVLGGYRIFDFYQINREAGGESYIFKDDRFYRWFSRAMLFKEGSGGTFYRFWVGREIPMYFTPLSLSDVAVNGMWSDIGKAGLFTLSIAAARPSNPVWSAEWSDRESREKSSVYMFGSMLSFKLSSVFARLYFTNLHRARFDLYEKPFLGSPDTSSKPSKIFIRFQDADSQDDVPLSIEGVEVYFQAGGAPTYSLGEGDFSDAYWDKGYLVESFGDVRVKKDGSARVASKGGYFSYAFDVPSDASAVIVCFKYSGRYIISLKTDLDGSWIPVKTSLPFVYKKHARDSVEWGFNTAKSVVGLSLKGSLLGLALDSEVALNSAVYQFPSDSASRGIWMPFYPAAYLSLSKNLDWLTVGTYFYGMSSLYSTDFESKYHLVIDNDDRDGLADWEDWDGVLPGLDRNFNGISDYDENQNGSPDYHEPFLMLKVDDPFFEVELDENNNGIADVFEMDALPDYPFRPDRAGAKLWVTFSPFVGTDLTFAGRYDHNWVEGNSARSLWALLNSQFELGTVGRVHFKDYLKRVWDEIPDDVLSYEKETTRVPLSDKLEETDNLMNEFLISTKVIPFPGLRIVSKFKHVYNNRFDTSSYLVGKGLLHRASYTLWIGSNMNLVPAFKYERKIARAYPEGSFSIYNDMRKTYEMRFNYFVTSDLSFSMGYHREFYSDIMNSGNDYNKNVFLIQVTFKNVISNHPAALLLGYQNSYIDYSSPAKEDTREYTIFAKIYAQ